MSLERFGEMPDGQAVERATISGGGLVAKFLNYGAVLQDLRLEGHDRSLVLGFETFPPYLTDSPYFGATAGRYANRIRKGHLELEGQTYQLDTNFLGKHLLHGGAKGIGKRLWRFDKVTSDAVTLSIDVADGEMGFPGNMTITQRFCLMPGGVLDIQIRASTDATTLCNIAHHSYFNLDGDPTILDHLLEVKADRYLPVDGDLIPTGDQAEVTGTSFDFRVAKPLRGAINTALIDHNYCVADERRALRTIAHVSSPKSGVSMEVRSTEPGLQIYDGSKVDIKPEGLDGFEMGPHAGLALEPQIWPDANHHAHFPQAILRPGEQYRQHTQYIFDKDCA